LELPAATVIVAGETTMLKFPTGGGGGVEFGPLHAIRLDNPMQRINSGSAKLTDWD
jgi:hypothetical protein